MVASLYRGSPLLNRPTLVVALYLEPGGSMDEHSAEVPILFLVTRGRGFVGIGGPSGETRSVAAGDAILWPACLVDCKAEWVDDLDQKQRVWQLCLETPPPVGFDPAPIYERVDHPNFGVLKLTPWRIELASSPGEADEANGLAFSHVMILAA